MKYLVSIVFWVVFVTTAPIGFLLGLVLWAVTTPFDPDRRILHRFICAWTFGYLRLNPLWEVKVEGRQYLPSGPAVLVANHQSMADVVAVMGLAHPYKYVSKASLFSLPLVGWMMTLLQYIRLERGSTRSTQRMMESCQAWLRRGMPILIFPEGTYSEGKRLLPFKRGAFQLAIDQQVPLVPVVIEGTTGLIEGDGPWLSPRCRIRIRVQPPVEVGDLGVNTVELADRLRARYREWLALPD
ncbi:MAG: 1-acyl-sn-glycerol-3-phosphate acyltransferase [Myxococcota bacterium]|nr:1-acyl-sn-glycerol-3-phosphate acyltransferase [Myxococcota bacterium]